MRLVSVCSGKGGTGKSCVTAYTGAALAAMKKKTLLIDAAPTPGALDLILGVHDCAIFNLWDALCVKCSPADAVTTVPGRENLYIIPAGAPSGKEKPEMSLIALIRALRNDFDYIILDGPGSRLIDHGIPRTTLVVTTPDSLAVRAAAIKSRELYEAGAQNLRLVINNVPPRILPMQKARDFDDIIDIVGAQLIAVIPASQNLLYCSNNGKPLSADSLTVRVFDNLAARLRGKHEPLLIK